jgi:RNA polymerase sigma-70 factor (ECF subfamily)
MPVTHSAGIRPVTFDCHPHGESASTVPPNTSDVDYDALPELMRRVRDGDGDAAAILVRHFEPSIRVAVRARLTDPRLRREFDSMDVCQSVLLSFFVRVALGRYQIREAAELAGLLIQIAQNKVASRYRAAGRLKRDCRRTQPLKHLDGMVDSRPSAAEPMRLILGKETLRRAHALMTVDGRRMAELRMQDITWDAIALQLGGTAQGRRKQFERELASVRIILEST